MNFLMFHFMNFSLDPYSFFGHKQKSHNDLTFFKVKGFPVILKEEINFPRILRPDFAGIIRYFR